ncbi:unnamed protein product [Dicrocoelium dendriticum]|nr:unnamed protein product [Dicrocoelium dendriticum]
MLNRIAASNTIRFIKTLSQLDLDFIPVESSLYTLSCRETGFLYSLPSHLVQDRQSRLEQLSEQLATVCVTLDEYPKICCRRSNTNLELARLTQSKLDACRESNPSMGRGLHKDRSILLILDRGFDPASPLLHELTLQAMCYDLLDIDDDTYTYGENRKANVTDRDPLWRELRHQHIADVTKTLPKRIREFAESKKQFTAIRSSGLRTSDGGYVNDAALADSGKKETLGLRELSDLIKRMPQYQSEAASYTAVYSITEACMNVFRRSVDKLCGMEQDLVMGQNAQGEPVRDAMRLISELVKYDFASRDDRLRMLMLFTLIKDGISENHLDKLLSTTNVEELNKFLFASFSFVLGAQLIQPESTAFISSGYGSNSSDPKIRFAQFESFLRLPPVAKVSDFALTFLPTKGKRKDRVDSNSYAFSRWTPYLMDILEETILGSLDKRHFAFVTDKRADTHLHTDVSEQSPVSHRGPSARFQPNRDASNPKDSRDAYGSGPAVQQSTGALDRGEKTEHCGPRLIVFIAGGVTWSESRVAYQVTQKCVETRLAESDRNPSGRTGFSASNKTVLSGSGGIGWNWEVIIGGTHMLTPKAFIGDLDSMSRHFVADLGSSTKQASPKHHTHRTSSDGSQFA